MQADRCSLKICEADPVPSMNQAPAAGPVGELALPGARLVIALYNNQ
jgi:hypothetical protein